MVIKQAGGIMVNETIINILCFWEGAIIDIQNCLTMKLQGLVPST